MTIDLCFRRSPWAVDSVGASTNRGHAESTVGRAPAPQVSLGPATRKPASITDRLPARLLESLRQAWARLLAPRDADAASLARRFEHQMPNLAAELRYFAAAASMDEHHSVR